MMFLSSDVHGDAPKLGPIRLTVSKEEALRRTQELFLEGRQINALYICTHEELQTANKRKLGWVARAAELLSKVTHGNTAGDFFDKVVVNVLGDSDPIETHSEQYHAELNQRLERLRTIRKGIEDIAEAISGLGGVSKRPANPVPQPQPLPAELATPVLDDPGVNLQQDEEAMGLPSGADLPGTAGATGIISSPPQEEKSGRSRKSVSKPAAKSVSKLSQTKVLLVLCSRNGTARQAICRFAAQMSLTFEIIDYNPDHPHQIVEQLYHHRDAKFAVVYWGEPTGREMPGSAHPERYVGFTLGFALGRLGRGRVFILGSVATPPLPGFARILVAQLDSTGGWQIQLARRMKSAGVDIDLNQLT